MSSHLGRCLVVSMAVLAFTAARARAQAVATGNEWAHSTELGVFAGGATGGGAAGATLGGTAAWQVSRFVAVEGRGVWFDRGTGASGFEADLSALVGFVPKQMVTPYVSAGFGLYRASFDSAGGAMPSSTAGASRGTPWGWPAASPSPTRRSASAPASI